MHKNSILTPLLVVGASGRTGSTLSMQLLATSKKIAFDRVYPFENRYLFEMLKWSIMFGDPTHQIQHPDLTLARAISGFPTGRLFNKPQLLNAKSNHESFAHICFRSIWREFNAEVRAKDENSIYYAEKTPLWVRSELVKAIQLKTIYRLRDPRDVWLSITSFDKKRRFYGFGREKRESTDAYLERYINVQKHFFNKVSNVKMSSEEIVIKYEDLITDIGKESRRLGEWLNVLLDPEVVKRQHPQFQHHMTSSSPKESVGRWERELDSNLNKCFIQNLGPELERFGYRLWPESIPQFYKSRKKVTLKKLNYIGMLLRKFRKILSWNRRGA